MDAPDRGSGGNIEGASGSVSEDDEDIDFWTSTLDYDEASDGPSYKEPGKPYPDPPKDHRTWAAYLQSGRPPISRKKKVFPVFGFDPDEHHHEEEIIPPPIPPILRRPDDDSPCIQPYCSKGCICISVHGVKLPIRRSRVHCRQVSCMFRCICRYGSGVESTPITRKYRITDPLRENKQGLKTSSTLTPEKIDTQISNPRKAKGASTSKPKKDKVASTSKPKRSKHRSTSKPKLFTTAAPKIKPVKINSVPRRLAALAPNALPAESASTPKPQMTIPLICRDVEIETASTSEHISTSISEPKKAKNASTFKPKLAATIAPKLKPVKITSKDKRQVVVTIAPKAGTTKRAHTPEPNMIAPAILRAVEIETASTGEPQYDGQIKASLAPKSPIVVPAQFALAPQTMAMPIQTAYTSGPRLDAEVGDGPEPQASSSQADHATTSISKLEKAKHAKPKFFPTIAPNFKPVKMNSNPRKLVAIAPKPQMTIPLIPRVVQIESASTSETQAVVQIEADFAPKPLAFLPVQNALVPQSQTPVPLIPKVESNETKSITSSELLEQFYSFSKPQRVYQAQLALTPQTEHTSTSISEPKKDKNASSFKSKFAATIAPKLKPVKITSKDKQHVAVTIAPKAGSTKRAHTPKTNMFAPLIPRAVEIETASTSEPQFDGQIKASLTPIVLPAPFALAPQTMAMPIQAASTSGPRLDAQVDDGPEPQALSPQAEHASTSISKLEKAKHAKPKLFSTIAPKFKPVKMNSNPRKLVAIAPKPQMTISLIPRVVLIESVPTSASQAVVIESASTSASQAVVQVEADFAPKPLAFLPVQNALAPQSQALVPLIHKAESNETKSITLAELLEQFYSFSKPRRVYQAQLALTPQTEHTSTSISEPKKAENASTFKPKLAATIAPKLKPVKITSKDKRQVAVTIAPKAGSTKRAHTPEPNMIAPAIPRAVEIETASTGEPQYDGQIKASLAPKSHIVVPAQFALASQTMAMPIQTASTSGPRLDAQVDDGPEPQASRSQADYASTSISKLEKAKHAKPKLFSTIAPKFKPVNIDSNPRKLVAIAPKPQMTIPLIPTVVQNETASTSETQAVVQVEADFSPKPESNEKKSISIAEFLEQFYSFSPAKRLNKLNKH